MGNRYIYGYTGHIQCPPLSYPIVVHPRWTSAPHSAALPSFVRYTPLEDGTLTQGLIISREYVPYHILVAPSGDK